MNPITIKPPTIGDLYQFVLHNKHNKVFTEYNNKQIVTLLMEGLMNNTLYYALDTEGKISGMILAEVQENKKTVFIVENLAMTLQNLMLFARKGREQFPGYHFQGYKHDKYKDYTKLSHRLT